MCRSIKTLRAPYAERVTDEDMHAAALQYVRKVSGFRAPAAHNADAFNEAVEAVTAATRTLLDQLEVRSAAGKSVVTGLPARRAGAARPRPAGAARPRPAGAARPRPAGAARPRPAGAARPRPAGGYIEVVTALVHGHCRFPGAWPAAGE